MEGDERYRRWLEQRARTEVPAGFADRVLAAVTAREASRRPAGGAGGVVLALFSPRWSKVGLCALGCLACVFRMAWIAALFLPE
jgi:hypothetical protein